MSNFESHIKSLLLSAQVPFVSEKTFPDLGGGRLRYDFYLPSLNVLIECDGAQHMYQVPKFQKTQSDFKAAQERDRRKNSYALAHNIPLYRIPYWEEQNIHSINDIFNPNFLVHSKWHNDKIYREYTKNL